MQNNYNNVGNEDNNANTACNSKMITSCPIGYFNNNEAKLHNNNIIDNENYNGKSKGSDIQFSNIEMLMWNTVFPINDNYNNNNNYVHPDFFDSSHFNENILNFTINPENLNGGDPSNYNQTVSNITSNNDIKSPNNNSNINYHENFPTNRINSCQFNDTVVIETPEDRKELSKTRFENLFKQALRKMQLRPDNPPFGFFKVGGKPPELKAIYVVKREGDNIEKLNSMERLVFNFSFDKITFSKKSTKTAQQQIGRVVNKNHPNANHIIAKAELDSTCGLATAEIKRWINEYFEEQNSKKCEDKKRIDGEFVTSPGLEQSLQVKHHLLFDGRMNQNTSQGVKNFEHEIETFPALRKLFDNLKDLSKNSQTPKIAYVNSLIYTLACSIETFTETCEGTHDTSNQNSTVQDTNTNFASNKAVSITDHDNKYLDLSRDDTNQMTSGELPLDIGKNTIRDHIYFNASTTISDLNGNSLKNGVNVKEGKLDNCPKTTNNYQDNKCQNMSGDLQSQVQDRLDSHAKHLWNYCKQRQLRINFSINIILNSLPSLFASANPRKFHEFTTFLELLEEWANRMTAFCDNKEYAIASLKRLYGLYGKMNKDLAKQMVYLKALHFCFEENIFDLTEFVRRAGNPNWKKPRFAIVSYYQHHKTNLSKQLSAPQSLPQKSNSISHQRNNRDAEEFVNQWGNTKNIEKIWKQQSSSFVSDIYVQQSLFENEETNKEQQLQHINPEEEICENKQERKRRRKTITNEEPVNENVQKYNGNEKIVELQEQREEDEDNESDEDDKDEEEEDEEEEEDDEDDDEKLGYVKKLNM